MGNLFSADYTSESQDFESMPPPEPTQEGPKTFDDFSKVELINHIKGMTAKSLDLSQEDAADLIKSIELENNELIPMAIEYYEKLAALFPEYVPEKPVYKKKTMFVKPQFGKKAVTAKFVNYEPDRNANIELINVNPQPEPRYHMEMNKVTSAEYDEAFRLATSNKDMTGISKKILSSASEYHKTRFINHYNRLIKGNASTKNIAFGRAVYMYKEAKHGKWDDINSFREIVVIPTIVNHFHRIMSLRLVDFLMKNNYLDTTIQKGSIPGISHGCIEQITKVKETVKEANKLNKKCSLMFLDISNAFGSLSQKQLFHIMKQYHVPEEFTDYVRRFYNDLQFWGKTPDWQTDLVDWEDGLMQGCPLSPIMFVMAMNYVLTYLDKTFKEECGYTLNNGTKVLFTAFVDDLTIVAKDEESLRKVYTKLRVLLRNMGMELNDKKCAIFNINGEDPQIEGVKVVESTKYLGEIISANGSIVENYTQFIKMLGRKLKTLDKKKINDDMKISIFARALYPWARRKMLVMYDLNKNDKLKVVNLIKIYTDKWGNDQTLLLIPVFLDILAQTNDEVIKSFDFDKTFQEEIKNDADLMKNVLTGAVDIKYSDINKEPQV